MKRGRMAALFLFFSALVAHGAGDPRDRSRVPSPWRACRILLAPGQGDLALDQVFLQYSARAMQA